MIKKLGLESLDDSASSHNFTTFAHFNFFEFETQITPLGIGLKPMYNFTSRYKVFVDDFFMQYLQSSAMTLTLCRSNGVDFYNFGTCNISFKDLVQEENKSSWLQFYTDVYDINDQKTIVGKFDFSLRLRIPMSQSIASYKERIVALNLLTVGGEYKDEASKRFGARGRINELTVHVKKCQGLIPPLSNPPSVYCSFDFYHSEDNISKTVKGSTSPSFDLVKMLTIPMTSDLDRYLKSSHV